jgi:hypothetical protein
VWFHPVRLARRLFTAHVLALVVVGASVIACDRRHEVPKAVVLDDLLMARAGDVIARGAPTGRPSHRERWSMLHGCVLES